MEELTESSTAARLGINNIPPTIIKPRLYVLAKGLEQIRERLGFPVHIDSGYRCQQLNAAVGGAKDSAHMDGYAADFTCHRFGDALSIVRALEGCGIRFDQLIQEGSWVHVSFDPRLRGQVMTAHFSPEGTTYSMGA